MQEGKLGALEKGRDADKLSRYLSDKVVLHDVQGTYPSLIGEVGGIQEYNTRALALPAAVVYVSGAKRDEIEKEVAYYKSIGIGPQEVRYVDYGDDSHPAAFTRAVFEDLYQREELELSRLSLFGQSEETQDIIREFAGRYYDDGTSINKMIYDFKWTTGLPTSRSADVSTGTTNDKGLMRAVQNDEKRLRSMEISVPYVAHYGFGENVTPEQIAGFEGEVLAILADYKSVYVKAVNGASGDGIQACASLEEVRNFLATTHEEKPMYRFIVEADLSEIAKKDESGIKQERSAQYLVDEDENGEIRVRFLSMTRQVVNDNVHTGNILTSDHNSPTEMLSIQATQEMDALVRYTAEKLNYRGYLSIDLLDTEKGPKALEVNARITGATAPLAILEQLRSTSGRHLAVMSKNTIEPTVAIDSFEDLQRVAGGLFYSPERQWGIIPTLITTLPKKLGVVAVGHNEAHAEEVMALFEQQLNGEQ